MIALRPATIEDLDLLDHWHQQPHVIAASGSNWGWAKELSRALAWREQLIAECDGRPIGFLQIIDPAEEDSHYWGKIAPGFRAIDIWIGDAADIDKGHGTAMMNLALARCFSSDQVHAVLVDPRADNLRAHRFYERLGFKMMASVRQR